jgi:hypothetical protein
MAVKNHVSLIAIASAAAQHSTINAKSIVWISNDGANDITFNFEEAVTTSGAWKLPAGATTPPINTPVGDIYYIATGGDTSFSLFGMSR